MLINGVEVESFRVVENAGGKWSSFVTDDFWRNLPPVEIALGTFFIVGFLLIYLMGSRSFCVYGCPYGALFKLADQLAPGRIKETGTCLQCGVCTANCTSDILIHKEIKEFGMVTNSNCLKDLDCVANCPENALGFAFTTPPLFKKKFKLPAYGKRYSFTLAEDIQMALVFIAGLLIFRGLYGIIPFLMSVGFAVALAYASVLLVRLFTKASTSINGMRLKISNSIRTPGYVFLTLMTMIIALSIHSAMVQYHTKLGQHEYEELNVGSARENVASDKAKAAKAIYHFERAASIGLMQPDFLRTQMASLYLLFDRTDDARLQLQAILVNSPENLKAHYRAGLLEVNAGDQQTALKHFELVSTLIPEDAEEHFMVSASFVRLAEQSEQDDQERTLGLLVSATEVYEQNVQAWLALGSYYLRNGNIENSIECLETVLVLDPGSALAHNNLAAINARTGNTNKAILHFKKLTELQPTNKQAYYNLGMMQMKVGYLNGARSSLKNALSIDPNYVVAQSGLTKLDQLQNDQKQ